MKRDKGKKSANKSAPGKPFQSGADQRRGNGPSKGAPNAGRPPDEFKALCRELATTANTIKAVRAILKDQDHSQFLQALRWASEHGYGKPTQPMEHSATGTLAELLAGVK